MGRFLYVCCFALISVTSLFAKERSDDFRYCDNWPVVDEIVQHMTLDQKIGHITLVPIECLHHGDGILDTKVIQKYNLGAVLIGGSASPDNEGNMRESIFDVATFETATLENYQKVLGPINNETIQVKWDSGEVDIPLLTGIDSVHGCQKVLGSILFPHNIGLAAAHDETLFEQIGYWTAHDTLQAGFNWIFAPCTNRAINYQWGRTYETLGVDADEIERNSAAFVRGAQMLDPQTKKLRAALATTKHFIGLGMTIQGADEGNVHTDRQYESFVKYAFPEYRGAINAHTGSIMCAYNAVDDIPMSINDYLLRDVLKGGKFTNMPYDGFVVSDYEAIGKVADQGLPTTHFHTTYQYAITRSMLAGMDMFMIAPPGGQYSIEHFQEMVKALVVSGAIPMPRLDDAVRRILAVKYAMGLIQKSKRGKWQSGTRAPMPEFKRASKQQMKQNSKDDQYLVALGAAQKSLVLLKNSKDLLPVNANKLKYIVLLGQRQIPVVLDDLGTTQMTLFQDFDNIGAQNGGWSVRWQGFEGNHFWSGEHKKMAYATSLLDGIAHTLEKYPQIELIYPQYSSYTDEEVIARESAQFFNRLKTKKGMTKDNTLIIVAMAESPYAEYMGDVNISYCLTNDESTDSGCLYNSHINAYLPKQQKTSLAITWDSFTESAIKLLQNDNKQLPVLTILFSGRPMIITEKGSDGRISAPLPASSAFIAAFLPGTSGGEALTRAIFGKYLFRGGDENQSRANTLPVDWLRNMAQLEDFPHFIDRKVTKMEDSLFRVGYGLATYAK